MLKMAKAMHDWLIESCAKLEHPLPVVTIMLSDAKDAARLDLAVQRELDVLRQDMHIGPGTPLREFTAYGIRFRIVADPIANQR